MCLMLYIGTASEIPLRSSPDLSVENVDEARQSVRQWFSRPVVQFLGAHTGCSCGFPSVIAEHPVSYYEGMPLQSTDRAADLRSVRALIELLGQVVKPDEPVELLPIGDGNQAMAPKGVIECQLDGLDPERFFLNEGFIHLIRFGETSKRSRP
jgi:hypothetical protein